MSTPNKLRSPHPSQRWAPGSLVVAEDVHGARLRLVGRGDGRVPLRRRRRELDGVLLRGRRGVAPARGVEVDEDDDEGVEEEREAAGA